MEILIKKMAFTQNSIEKETKIYWRQQCNNSSFSSWAYPHLYKKLKFII